MKRVWIYQSNRLLSAEEVEQISQILQEFVVQWTAHGNQLAGSFLIKYNLFVILQVDEGKAMVTGCSIDKSVHLLKKIEERLDVSLFDRMQIAYRRSEDEIVVAGRDRFEQLIAAGEVDRDTIVFNNMVGTAQDFADNWEVPLKDSWHAKVFL
ncbi:ABC transporter ATPase [Sphingobacterium suaedae]|uniref:ABC transporter ATPase n=1 Tax=Sphingobacterium suaedae TaxID=1686402 RepID=A0ABW5KK13_9SPHI